MRFVLLGQFAAGAAGQTLTRRRQERQLLAALLLHRDRPVAVGSLVDIIWGDRAPREAHRLVQCHLSRLRSALSATGADISIVTGPCSYQLQGSDVELDVAEFARLVEWGMAAPDPADRARLLRRALALWQPPILADFTHPRVRATLAAPLEEQRLAAVDALFRAELERDGEHRVLADVVPLRTEYPYHDRLIYFQMLALHRAGRAVEALRTYRDYWLDLRREMGLTPGRDLEALQGQILRGTPPRRLTRAGAA